MRKKRGPGNSCRENRSPCPVRLLIEFMRAQTRSNLTLITS